ncbi:polysaccharide deacetylase family protein [Pseudodesulfovibrio sp. zrk46]|uniref:polysaccharide deacetylase family protein n=1 Tax=Pseudodesulfovibrio sp. zrk46 TaxID=2725288 RepID=UPI001448D543|nr:polysaccharide deacetylase family protein [Pseudodesulfovibrio sp. zrk46]QJB55774.1 hypothetical protein HFN16_04860 [Pseudodesulfovibrio sp. zrk46]
MTLDVLNTLFTELGKWAQAEMTASFWWRDDDAGEPCIELDRLIGLSDQYAAPCGLATIPVRAGEPLRKTLAEAPHVWVLQHGYAHVNHAPKGNGAWELGLHRPVSTVLDELRQGMLKLSQLFKERFVPVVVPPWNKMDPELLPYLPVMGFRGVSASYKAHRPVPPGDLRVADAHCDLLSWKGKDKSARFAGSEKCVTSLVDHLKDKRTGRTDETEPTCVLTHHLEMDEAAWDFMDTLLSVISGHPAATWVAPVDIWPAN